MTGGVLIIAPHPDDESLGCGLLLASHPEPHRIHIAFVTDGAGQGPDRAMQSARREAEARAAAAVYGIQDSHLHFFNLPDGKLARHEAVFVEKLRVLLSRLLPASVHVPFRFDRHSDHMMVNRVACALHDAGELKFRVLEYFVYTRLRLVPGGDLRRLIDPALLVRILPEPDVVEVRRRALECHRSQLATARPVLSRSLLDGLDREEECHLAYDARAKGSKVLTSARAWIPVAVRLEPVLKSWSDRLRGRG